MFLNPAIMALLLVSALVVLMVLAAALFALQVVRRWNINSGSEQQLVLERRTYLISTLLGWVFSAELLSLLLFIYNAEAMSGQFVGAMCATGVLNTNVWGWPTLYLKMAIFFSGSSWLILNYLDNQGFDYPLIKLKYILLLLIAPLIISEMAVQWLFFSELNPSVITSCCGALFSAESEGVAAEVASISPGLSVSALYGSGALTISLGVWTMRRASYAWLFSLSAVGTFVISLVAIVSFIALYIYEHPHHHCPFCILKSGHGYIGFALYLPLFFATAAALATGVVSPWRTTPSLKNAASSLAPKMALYAIVLFSVFFIVTSWAVIRSNLTMTGVWW